jgi:hypothetical protein
MNEDQTPRVPDLWWSAKHEDFFLRIDGAYYVAQVEAEDNPLGAGRPSDADKLARIRELTNRRALVSMSWSESNLIRGIRAILDSPSAAPVEPAMTYDQGYEDGRRQGYGQGWRDHVNGAPFTHGNVVEHRKEPCALGVCKLGTCGGMADDLGPCGGCCSCLSGCLESKQTWLPNYPDVRDRVQETHCTRRESEGPNV